MFRFVISLSNYSEFSLSFLHHHIDSLNSITLHYNKSRNDDMLSFRKCVTETKKFHGNSIIQDV